MTFDISCASGRKPPIKGIKEYDDIYCKNYTIEINTLEELMNLCEDVDDALIVRVDFFKFNNTKEYSIQIYDDYIE